MTTEFLGKPVTGDINRYTSAAPKQEDPAVLMDALTKVLDHPLVEYVRWQQYTPYFNDGDACEFNIYEVTVKLADIDQDGDYDDGRFGEWELGYYESTKNLEGVDELRELMKSLNGHISSGAHYVILNEKFGDPAEVTATNDGFNVEYYEHD